MGGRRALFLPARRHGTLGRVRGCTNDAYGRRAFRFGSGRQVRRHLPAAWGKPTVFELLQHASGIPDYRANPGFKDGQNYKPAELVALVADKPALFKAGTDVRMSATDFLLLGLVIERASGMSFHDYVMRYQIEPLGLHATMFAEDFPTKSFPDRDARQAGAKQHSRFKMEVPFINPVEPAVGYREAEGKLGAIDAGASRNLFAFGSLWSSAEDISAWDIGLAGGVLVKREENRALIYKPTKLANGTVVPAMTGWSSRSIPASWRSRAPRRASAPTLVASPRLPTSFA